jgi:hypothetical protein
MAFFTGAFAGAACVVGAAASSARTRPVVAPKKNKDIKIANNLFITSSLSF